MKMTVFWNAACDMVIKKITCLRTETAPPAPQANTLPSEEPPLTT
jgi:hypothetical protein